MERADISLNKGIHRSPNYSRNKGELSECVNIMPVQGELKNIPKASNVKAEYDGSDVNVKMPTGHTLAAIHKMQTGKRYISLSKSVGVRSNPCFLFIINEDPNTNPNYWKLTFVYALDVDIQIEVAYIHGGESNYITGTLEAGQNTYDLSQIDDFSSIDFVNDRLSYRESTSPIRVTNPNNSEYRFRTYSTTDLEPEDVIRSYVPLNLISIWSAPEGDVSAEGILNFTQIENSEKEGEDERKFSTIGNTVIEYGDSGTNYYLWSGSAYTNLGSQLPYLEAKPYLRTRLLDNTQMNATFGANMNAIANPSLVGDGLLTTTDVDNLYDYKAYKDAYKAWEKEGRVGPEPEPSGNATAEKYLYGTQRENIASRVFAMLNQYAEIIKREGLFYAPFFIRLAYRMYDGSHVMHTPPVLLTPNTIGQPVMRVLLPNNSTANLNPIFMTSSLYADIFVPEDIDKWYDIITHVDIYITPQIVSYTDSSESIISISFNEEYEGTYNDVYYYDENRCDITGRYMTVEDDEDTGESVRKMLKTHDNTDYTVDYMFGGISQLKTGRKYSATKNKNYKENYWIFKTNSSSFNVIDASGNAIPKLPSIPPELEALLPSALQNNYTAYLVEPAGVYGAVMVNTNAELYTYFGPITNTNQAIAFTIKMQRADNAGLEKLVAEESSFHLVSSIEIDKVSGMEGPVEIREGVLNTVETRETLPEVGQGRRSYIFDDGISYNNRMNLVVDKETLPSTDTIEDVIVHCSGSSNAAVIAYVMCKENGQTVYRRIDTGQLHVGDKVIYYAYPSSTAVKLLMKTTKSSPTVTYYNSIVLKAHSILDIAQAFENFDDVFEVGVGDVYNAANPSQAQKEFEAAQAGERYVEYGNKIVVSNPDNPFVFREDQFKILNGKILGIATTSKPLSEGQYGQFPLYAFCDDGVWALEVNKDGTYQSPQIVSGEVCNNKNTITQLDDGVSFTTDGGLLLLMGREMNKISSVLDGYNVNDSAILSGLTQAQLAGWYGLLDNDTSEFAGWCSQATYAFDSVNKLIRIYCAGKRQMVYSLESGEFAEQIDGFAISQNMRVINDYPYIIVQDGQNLYTYRKMLDDGTDKLGFALTRIINAEGADTYTAIMQVKTFLNSIREHSALRTLYCWNGAHIAFTESATPMQGDIVYGPNRMRVGIVSSYDSEEELTVVIYDTQETEVVYRDDSGDIQIGPSVKIAILGSNDMSTWIPLLSLKGQSFKHFRVAFFSDMYDNDSLSGMTLMYETRRTNKLR